VLGGGKVKNKELADIFDKWADILEFMGDNPYHIRAYKLSLIHI
jgi:DNA polymerase (family 10)